MGAGEGIPFFYLLMIGLIDYLTFYTLQIQISNFFLISYPYID